MNPSLHLSLASSLPLLGWGGLLDSLRTFRIGHATNKRLHILIELHEITRIRAEVGCIDVHVGENISFELNEAFVELDAFQDNFASLRPVHQSMV